MKGRFWFPHGLLNHPLKRCGAKCRTTLLSQTIFGGKKLPFWIECEVMKHHPLFDDLMKDRTGAKAIYVRSSTVAEAPVSQEFLYRILKLWLFWDVEVMEKYCR